MADDDRKATAALIGHLAAIIAELDARVWTLHALLRQKDAFSAAEYQGVLSDRRAQMNASVEAGVKEELGNRQRATLRKLLEDYEGKPQ